MSGIFRALFFVFFFSQQAHGLSVIGHRGARASFPESSLTGFIKATEWGVDFLEMDLRMTRDQQIIIHHDEFLNSKVCTREDGEDISDKVYPGQLSLFELKKFDCGSKIHPSFPSQIPVPFSRILALTELLAELKRLEGTGQKIPALYMEIKVNTEIPDFPAEVWAHTLGSNLTRSGFLRQTYIDSFNEGYKRTVHEYLDQLSPPYPAKSVKAWPFQILSERWVRHLQARGHLVFPWTVNRKADWDQMILWGVDGIITDDPFGLIRHLENRNHSPLL